MTSPEGYLEFESLTCHSKSAGQSAILLPKIGLAPTKTPHFSSRSLKGSEYHGDNANYDAGDLNRSKSFCEEHRGQ